MVELPGTEDKYPAELSGGMRKRVGIARAIALKPRYILYDEPTTGLDPVTSAVMDQLMIRTRDLGVTGLVVTHDMRSAFSVGDRIAMLHEGAHPPGRHRRRDPGDRRSGGAPVHRGPSGPRRRRRGGSMKRSNEFAVGLAVLAALALVIGGALWLSETDVNQKEATYTARFRTVGGLGVGAPVTLRGVQGRPGRGHPPGARTNGWRPSSASTARSSCRRKPAVISASASLFGEWSANIVSFEPLPTDPNLRDALVESDQAGGEAWPGATLPDIGQLTAQASRIAGDVGDITAADRPGLRQHRAQEHAAEREGPGRDLPAAGEVRQRADHPHRPREPERGHHLGRLRRGGPAPSRARWPGSTPRRATTSSRTSSTTAGPPAPTCGRPPPTCARSWPRRGRTRRAWCG